MLRGICPVLETPFHADHSVDEAGFGRVIDAMTAAGVQSAMFPGFASEFHTLTDAERRRLSVKVESQPPGRLIAALAAQPQPLPSLVGYAGLQLPDALRRGAVGVQPGCSFVEIYLEIWRRWTSGDQQQAEALHQRLVPYLAYWMQHVNLIVAAEKTISVARGWFASDTCRRPGWQLDAEERAMIDRFLDEFADHLLPGPRPADAAQTHQTEQLEHTA